VAGTPIFLFIFLEVGDWPKFGHLADLAKNAPCGGRACPTATPGAHQTVRGERVPARPAGVHACMHYEGDTYKQVEHARRRRGRLARPPRERAVSHSNFTTCFTR
jgi:hypothetical protein